MEPMARQSDPARRTIFGWQLPVILLLALALRLIYFTWAQSYALGYETDSIEAYQVAVHYEAGGERAHYIGQPNCNIHSKLPGPLWTLICVAGLKLAGSINGVVLLIIFGNIVAMALTWWLARDLAGVRAANLAILIMATSLWAIQYSSIVWNPSLMSLLGAVIFLVFFRCLRQPKSRFIAVIPLLLLAGAQLHMSVLSLILPLILCAWLTRLKPNWPWLGVGIVAGLLTYIPYVLGDSRHGWANTRGMLFGGPGGFSPDALKVFSSPFTFLVNVWDPGWTYAPGERAELARQAFGGITGMVVINGISALFAAGTFWGAIHAVKAVVPKRNGPLREQFSKSPGLLLAATLFLMYLGFNLISGKPFHARYCLLVAPLLFTLAGCGAARCLESPGLRRIFLPVLVITIAADIWFMPVICHFERERIMHGPLFVPSCAKMETVYQQLETRAPGWITINDSAYLQSFSPDNTNNIYRHVHLLDVYINIRQSEQSAADAVFTNTNRFVLRAADQVNTNDPAVAFYGNGIALVAAPAKTDQR
jgi:hypothetical protein